MSLINQMYNNDCLSIVKQIPSCSVDLIYLDPPFFTNRNFEMFFNNEIMMFEDKWNKGIFQYLDWLKVRLIEFYRILKNSGSIFFHCDIHASHYIKILMDQIFGFKMFRNEIIWKRHNAHNNSKQGSRHLGKIHDTILHYSKTNNFVWNRIYEEYSRDYVDKVYKYVEKNSGKRFALGDLTGPGGPGKGNPYFEFRGFFRYWRYNKEKIKNLDYEGRIFQKDTKSVPLLKRYFDEMKGKEIQDIWDDISPLRKNNKEFVGYPTQKPVALLERIIELSSNRGDLVLDPFCGSGTTLVAATNLSRNCIGIDINQDASKIAKKRIPSLNIHINDEILINNVKHNIFC